MANLAIVITCIPCVSRTRRARILRDTASGQSAPTSAQRSCLQRDAANGIFAARAARPAVRCGPACSVTQPPAATGDRVLSDRVALGHHRAPQPGLA